MTSHQPPESSAPGAEEAPLETPEADEPLNVAVPEEDLIRIEGVHAALTARLRGITASPPPVEPEFRTGDPS